MDRRDPPAIPNRESAGKVLRAGDKLVGLSRRPSERTEISWRYGIRESLPNTIPGYAKATLVPRVISDSQRPRSGPLYISKEILDPT